MEHTISIQGPQSIEWIRRETGLQVARTCLHVAEVVILARAQNSEKQTPNRLYEIYNSNKQLHLILQTTFLCVPEQVVWGTWIARGALQRGLQGQKQVRATAADTASSGEHRQHVRGWKSLSLPQRKLFNFIHPGVSVFLPLQYLQKYRRPCTLQNTLWETLL